MRVKGDQSEHSETRCEIIVFTHHLLLSSSSIGLKKKEKKKKKEQCPAGKRWHGVKIDKHNSRVVVTVKLFIVHDYWNKIKRALFNL